MAMNPYWVGRDHDLWQSAKTEIVYTLGIRLWQDWQSNISRLDNSRDIAKHIYYARELNIFYHGLNKSFENFHFKQNLN